jgi:hypothetical protein
MLRDIDILFYGESISVVQKTFEMAIDDLLPSKFLTHCLTKENLEFNGRFMAV